MQTKLWPTFGQILQNFVAMATVVGLGRIGLTSFHSSALKTFAGRKGLGDISHISRVIANFSSNFVPMATRVGRFVDLSDLIK